MSKQSKLHSRSQRTKYIKEIEDKRCNQSLVPNQDLALINVGAEARQPIKVEVIIGDSPLIMEVDTGAVVSIIYHNRSTNPSFLSTNYASLM